MSIRLHGFPLEALVFGAVEREECVEAPSFAWRNKLWIR